MLDQVRDMFPMVIQNRFIGAGLIIAVSFGLAFLIDRIVVRACRIMAHRTRVSWDDRLIDIIHQPVRVTVMLLGLWLATARLMLPATPQKITADIIQTIAVLIWMVFGIRLVTLVLAHMSLHKGTKVVEPRTKPLFDILAKIVVIGAAVYFIFLFWNIDVTAWLASAGIIGIAVGFAAKDTLANRFSGISILADAPYKVGDFINLDSGERGEVTHIGLRSTRVLTRDDVEVTLPNALIANAKIVNESGGPSLKQRIRARVGVAYGSDVDQVRNVLTEIAMAQPQTCSDPEPRVRFRGLGEYSLDFELLCWVEDPVLRGRVLDALYTEIYKRLGREGIEIPYPKRDLYIREAPVGSALKGKR